MAVAISKCEVKEKMMRNRMSVLIVTALLAVSQSLLAQEVSKQSEEQARREQLRIAVQEICPISGQKLGSMGEPIKVTVGESKEEVYLCCKGCLKREIDPKHWATIHHNLAVAQGKCPIMKKELPKKVKWTVVEGQLIYVCCPPCIKKIEANPEESRAQVDAYYTAYLEKKAEEEKRREVR